MGRNRVDFDRLLAGVGVVTLEVLGELRDATGLSESYLRKKLMERGHPMEALVEGVRQDSVENLEQTLGALAVVYGVHPNLARGKVLEARRHLDFALRREPGNPLRQAALLHLRTWLENPTVYPLWARLQKQKPPGVDAGGF